MDNLEHYKNIYKTCMKECRNKLDELGIEYDKYEFEDFAYGYYEDVRDGKDKTESMATCLDLVFGYCE